MSVPKNFYIFATFLSSAVYVIKLSVKAPFDIPYYTSMYQVTKRSPALATCISRNIKNIENAELF